MMAIYGPIQLILGPEPAPADCQPDLARAEQPVGTDLQTPAEHPAQHASAWSGPACGTDYRHFASTIYRPDHLWLDV